ncbi:MAG: hypothetical protein Q7S82_02615 [bacterium]|nr:hypothetical protein [bacterium]
MAKFSLFIPIFFLAGAMLLSGGSAIGAIDIDPPPFITSCADKDSVCPPGAICIQNPLCAQSFEDIIESVINFIFYIALAITPLMILVGAFYYLTSAGDPKKIKTAQDIFLYTAIGFAIILLSKGLVAIIKQVLSLT